NELLALHTTPTLRSSDLNHENNGVRVILFEMPVNETLCDLAEPQMIREYYRRYFPESKYDYIRVPHCDGYMTTDGAHLGGVEALDRKSTRLLQSRENIAC